MTEPDSRTDPAQIISVTGGIGPRPANPQRVTQVWAHVASQAGWSVEVVEDYRPQAPVDFVPDVSATECGAVDIEGLRYVVMFGRRVRLLEYDDSTGSLQPRPSFGYAAWAEPVLTPLD